MSVLGGNTGGEDLHLFHRVRTALNHSIDLVDYTSIGRLGADSVEGETDVVLSLSLNVKAGLADHADDSRHIVQQVNGALHDAGGFSQHVGGERRVADHIFGVQQGGRCAYG